jgi:subtilisin
VAGIVALTAPDARVMPLRAFDHNGFGASFNISQAIRFAADNGAKVINMSFGLHTKNDKLIKEALNYAKQKAFLVASAGNQNRKGIEYPAAQRDRTFSVTATSTNDLKAPFANYDDKINASAPGVMLYSAYPGRRWAWWSGTSFSTAFVSGEAAILLSLDRELNVDKVDKYIEDTGVDIDRLNGSYKKGLGRRIDIRTAIEKLLKIK